MATNKNSLISVLALVISLFSFIFTISYSQSEQKRLELIDFRDIITQIAAQQEKNIELARHIAELDPTRENNPAVLQYYQALAVSNNNKLLILVESAERLLTSIKRAVTPVELSILAVGYQNLNHMEKAEGLYKTVAEGRYPPYYRASASASLGNLYAHMGPAYRAKTLAAYDEAIKILTADESGLLSTYAANIKQARDAIEQTP